MESKRGTETICRICDKTFSNKSARNKHLKKFHPDSSQDLQEKLKRIMCPLCQNNEKFSFYLDLNTHLSAIHTINVKESIFCFRNFVEFEEWRACENREVDYACRTRRTCPNGEVDIFYECNRSDSYGSANACSKRSLKTGGSIRIDGTCPSKINVRIHNTGEVTVKFTETHVGHIDELRTKRLSKGEQDLIVRQLEAGVSTDRIIQDARQIENETLKRKNLITRADLRYLMRKFNIDKKRHDDDMIATCLKIEEWNREGKNNAFLFKKIGESYSGLRDNDFAVGYMNGIMEKKLRDFKRVICVDGTHGTNRRNYELTTLLVKDENNMGFPVAFLVSNRLDQQIQEIFFRALRSRLGESIEAEYLMSDDDPKYYNAWTKVMDVEHKARRLLCTWHVIKNWNIQGRLKIKNAEIRQEMKTRMRKILKETDEAKFTELKKTYFSYLQEAGETDFLRYLQTYYFQSEERIMMWAHCNRINAGINTNMAIESLNKLLKYNKMMGQRNIRVERLLDLLDEIVDEKMWKKIVSVERPNSNNYQHKVTLEAHRKAENMAGNVEISEAGVFKVKSCSDEGKFYFVSYNELCNKDCRTSYCTKCKICLHRYDCQCPENTVKFVLCKHIHAVALYEQRSDFVLDSSSNEDVDETNLHIDVPSTTKLNYQDEVAHFIQENLSKADHVAKTTFEERREIAMAATLNFSRTLDEETFEVFMAGIMKLKNSILEKQDTGSACRKRKMEKQTYYPSKKPHHTNM